MNKKILIILVAINFGAFFYNGDFLLLNSVHINSEKDKLMDQRIGNLIMQTKAVQSSGRTFNFSQYQLFLIQVTWIQAKSNCENLDMYLVTISSFEEELFVTSLANGNNIWIGLTDEVNEGNWEWVNGEPVIYTNWNTGQPDDFGIGEDFAEVSPEGLWNDRGEPNDNTSLPYVCESDIVSEDIQSSVGNFNFSYYRVFYIPMTWEQSKSSCEDLDMYLVTITSAEENIFVSNLAKYMNIWIGLTDEDNEGNWEWITGEPVVYTNWPDGEPNDSQPGEDYAEFGLDGSWNDNGGPSDYNVKNMFVCEFRDSDQDQIPDHIEIQIGLDPNKNDANDDLDGDEIPNFWEYEMGLDPSVDDADKDPDKDGLTNLEEFELGSSPKNNDTDFDGMLDSWEVAMELNLLENDANEDKDGDLIPNIIEFNEGSNANSFWIVPIFKSEFPFFYLSLPIFLLPAILIIFLGIGGGIGFVVKRSKKIKLIKETRAPDYDTALHVKKGKFIDYEQYKNAEKFSVTTLIDYELALELKNRQDEYIDT